MKHEKEKTTMKARKVLAVAPVLALCMLSTAVSHAQDAPSNVGTANCGRVSSPLYCYGIPATVNGVTGTLWIDTYVTGYNAGTGFVLFMGGLNSQYGEATVTGVSPSPAAGQVTSLTINFKGSDYKGTLTVHFSYAYSAGGGGKGGGGAGWHFTCTGGSLSFD
jgi:hypothetical protein